MKELKDKYFAIDEVIELALRNYYDGESCACQFPRFIQIIGIDCSDYYESFHCFETTKLISKVRPFFKVKSTEKNSEMKKEIWTCLKCNSEFEYGWSEFSLIVDRDYLKPRKLNIEQKGKAFLTPIPLHAGLYGHGYPTKDKIVNVDIHVFSDYILEKE